MRKHYIAIAAVILIAIFFDGWLLNRSYKIPAAQTSESVVAELATRSNPVTVFGLYNCRGWAGALVVQSDGSVIGPLSLKPAEADALAKKANIPAAHQQHIFPAQGDCGPQAEAPGYQQEHPDSERTPASPLTTPDGRQTI